MDRLFRRRPERALTSDYRPALIFLVGILTTVFVGGFAVYRLVIGSYLIAVLDGIIVLVACGSAIYAQRTGKVEQAGTAVSILLTILAIAGVVEPAGRSGAVSSKTPWGQPV